MSWGVPTRVRVKDMRRREPRDIQKHTGKGGGKHRPDRGKCCVLQVRWLPWSLRWTMLTYVFLFTVASVLLFQGVHLLGETEEPFGVVPEEVAFPSYCARSWGLRLVWFGSLTGLLGLLSFPFPSLAEYLVPTIIIDGCALAAFAVYLVFFAPRVQYIGKPTDSGHH